LVDISIDIRTAFYVLCAAVALGCILAIPYLRGEAIRLPWPAGAAHGTVGAAGLAMLVLVLCRGLPPSAMGTAGFAPAAAVFIALALVLGLIIALWRRRPHGVLVAIHASLAVAGFVVLWTVVSLG
jgi:hypothetical protein